jgi:pilus assembly protein Flp/PilA
MIEDGSLIGRYPLVRRLSNCAECGFWQYRVVTFHRHREVEVARIALAARRFIKDEEGAALAEYGILVAFIAIVAITAVTFFGSKISAKFSTLATSFT